MGLFSRKQAVQPVFVRERQRAYAPHCDQRVLHAPGECAYCDGYDDWQRLREMWGINFTGHDDERKLLCPSELARPLEIINKWAGNRPRSMVQIIEDEPF